MSDIKPETKAAKVQAEFHCPVCHASIDYGVKNCPVCQTAIFYRDMSETFWNERKLKLFRHSDAIHRIH